MNAHLGDVTNTCEGGNIIGKNTGVYVGGFPDDFVIRRGEKDSRSKVNRYTNSSSSFLQGHHRCKINGGGGSKQGLVPVP